MGSFSAIHWLIALLVIAPVAALMVVPAWRILQRAGHSGAWALLMLVPVLGFVVLWVLAFSKWPNDKDGKTSTSVPGIILGIVLVPLSIGSVVMLSSAGMRVAGPVGQAATTPSQSEPLPKTMTYEEAYGLPPAKRSQPEAEDEWWKKNATPITQSDWEKGVLTPPPSR
ncbi:MAG: DUF805 domain-containing protein [Burkholderiaceae bacterium]|jgi:uncharacterized membrane protein YhaH (DUF805 family)|nr:DUF805 domain-containing protein [Burkholderiaceae bacterium]MDR3018654.1 DUF805 domain-containing protein [Delftia acidovorans]